MILKKKSKNPKKRIKNEKKNRKKKRFEYLEDSDRISTIQRYLLISHATVRCCGNIRRETACCSKK